MDGSNVITRKNFFMKSSNQLEVILFSQYSLKDIRQRELVRWLGTTAQTIIKKQQEKAKKISLPTLKATPAIYLS
jgi:DNA-binding Xre family transcriptional regulator